MSAQSIYSVIYEGINSEGKLPKDFTLPFKKTSPNELKFMPGAKDGIGIFHFGAKSSEKVSKKIVKLLKSDCKKGSISSQNEIAELLNECGTLAVIDPILDSIRKEQKKFDIENLFDYACQFAFQSTDEELVKLGIGLLGLFDLSNDDKIIDKLLVLALYEEFTLYVIVAVLKYPNGNDIVFRIAQKVDGWGKIHAVERLEPTSDKIREWILRKGCANEIMDAYLGLECANKGNLIGALRHGSIDDELFEGISVIIDALLDEGPVEGISVYEYAEEALRLYLQIASEHAVTITQFWRILNLQDWLINAQIAGRDELLKMCGNIINKESWREMILKILNSSDDERFFYAYDAAKRLNMDISELIFKAVKRNPVKRCGYLSIVYKNPEYANELTKIYEEILPLDEMATGMGDFIFAESLTEEHLCMVFVLEELKNYPKMGEKLVRTALKSPVIRERNGACIVMKEWCRILNQDLQTISPDLFSTLKKIVDIEVNADTKDNMRELLNITPE